MFIYVTLIYVEQVTSISRGKEIFLHRCTHRVKCTFERT